MVAAHVRCDKLKDLSFSTRICKRYCIGLAGVVLVEVDNVDDSGMIIGQCLVPSRLELPRYAKNPSAGSQAGVLAFTSPILCIFTRSLDY